MDSRVASGLFQYPFITLCPLTIISPTSPVGSSLPLSSTIFIWTRGNGGPIEPGLRIPFGGLHEVTGLHSVGPSPSHIGILYFASKAFITSTGSAAPPDMHNFHELKFILGNSIPAHTAYMEGTPANNVTFSSSIFLRTSTGLKRPIITTLAPKYTGAIMHTVAANAWKRGRTQRKTS